MILINETEYNSITEGINSGENNVTVVLEEDLNEDIVVPTSTVITIDLNGHTITNVSSHTISNYGTLTIQDTVGTGVVDNITHVKASLYNYPNGIVVLNGGTYTRSQETGASKTSSGGNSYYTILNNGTMTINDGVTVQASSPETSQYSSLVENGWYDGSKNTEGIPSVMVINGGNFTCGLNTIKNDDYGELTINGGNFTNTIQSCVMNWNEATVTDGEFVSDYNVFINGQLDDAIDKGELTIEGGSFTAGENYSIISIHSSATSAGTPVVSGGTFSTAIPEEYIKEGVSMTVNEDGSVTAVDETVTPEDPDTENEGETGTDTIVEGDDTTPDNPSDDDNRDDASSDDEEPVEDDTDNEEVDTSRDVTEESPDDSYLNVLGKIADAAWEIYGGQSDYVNTADTTLIALKEIANGIRGVTPDETDAEVAVKQPKTIIQALLSIRNAIKGEEDDFSVENYPELSEEEPVARPSIMDVLTVLDPSTDLLGKTTEDLCTVKFFEDNLVGGVINYIEDYTGFSSKESEQKGYYVAFGFEANDDIASMTMFVVNSKNEKPVVTCDTENVLFLGSAEDIAKKKAFVLTGYDADGNKVAQKIFKVKNINFIKEVTEDDTTNDSTEESIS